MTNMTPSAIAGTLCKPVSAYSNNKDIVMKLGTNAHICVETYALTGKRPNVRPVSYLRKCMDQWDQFCRIHEVETLCTELKVMCLFDGEMMTGSIDIIARVDGKLTLIDLKTGANQNNDAARLQLSLYKVMLETTHPKSEHAVQAMVIYMPVHGGWSEKTLDFMAPEEVAKHIREQKERTNTK